MSVALIPRITTAGVKIHATRVLFDEATKHASVSITNDSRKPYLLKSWVTDADNRTSPFFTVTPPVRELKSGKEMTVRILRKKGDLPTDRESVFYFNVMEIPPSTAQKNVIELAPVHNMKLFYRPQHLSGSLAQATTHLEWSTKNNNTLEVHNPSKYHITLIDIKLSNGSKEQMLKAHMVKPEDSITWPLRALNPNEPVTVTFATVNDQGGSTKPLQVSIDPSKK